MQTTFRELFGLTGIDQPIEMGETFTTKGSMVEFTIRKGYVTCLVSIPQVEFAKLLLGSKRSPIATTLVKPKKGTGKEEVISEEEMNSPLALVKKQTRNIKCPKTLELISSDEYQKRKGAGLYEGFPVINGRIRPMSESKPQ